MVFNDHHRYGYNHRYGDDHLILARGAGSTYFGHEEWRPLAPPMKIIEHADEIRRRLPNRRDGCLSLGSLRHR